MVKKSKNLKKSERIPFFQQFFFEKKRKIPQIKLNCYPLSFPILEGHNLTRALQSTPFQNSGGIPWARRRMKSEVRRTEIFVSTFGFTLRKFFPQSVTPSPPLLIQIWGPTLPPLSTKCREFAVFFLEPFP